MEKKIPNLVQSTKDLASLVKLEQNASLQQTPEDLYDFIVHNTRQLISYDVGVLWIKSNNEFVKFSDVDLESNNAPIIELLKNLIKKKRKEPITKISYDDFKGHFSETAKQHLFKHTLLIEIELHGTVIGCLILSRSEMWHKREIILLDNLRFCYGTCIGCFNPIILKQAYWKRVAEKLLSKKGALISLIILLSFLTFTKIPLTVLAPAEVTSRTPVFIRSAIDGVIDKVHVSPNIFVKQGTKLISLNKQNIESELNIIEKKRALVSTQLNVAKKSGLSDRRQKEKIPVYEMEIKKSIAEIEYYKHLLSKTNIYAPKSGLILFDQTHKLEGRPVKTGENIMLLSDKKESALDIYLPVADAINMEQGAKIKFFLNTVPQKPVEASIIYASYQAQVTPDGVLAYHIRAGFDQEKINELPRIGLRGVAKMYGEDVSLLFYLLRKPLSYLRQKIGL